jgi:hypothetical protein
MSTNAIQVRVVRWSGWRCWRVAVPMRMRAPKKVVMNQGLRIDLSMFWNWNYLRVLFSLSAFTILTGVLAIAKRR